MRFGVMGIGRGWDADLEGMERTWLEMVERRRRCSW